MSDEQIIIQAQPGKQSLALDIVDKVNFSLYGGSRGCFDGNTEFLTSVGWFRFDEFESIDETLFIAAYNCDTKEIEYEVPERFIKLSCDTFVNFKGEFVDHTVSTEHTMFLFDEDRNAYKFPIPDIIGWKCAGDRLRRDLFMLDPINNKLLPLSDVKITVTKKEDFKYCFETSTGALVVRSNGKVVVSGNSGKSYLLNLLPLKHCLDDPNYHAVAFRRERSEILQPGGIWQTAMELYPLFGGIPNLSNLRWTFPVGSSIVFSHMFNENDAQSWRGSQLSAVLFDEINRFLPSQISFLMTCLRSKARNMSYMFGSLNPDPDHLYLLDFVRDFLDEEGFPREEMCGKIRYFIIIGGEVKTADTSKELEDRYPDSVRVKNINTGEVVYVPPKSYTLISGTIFDNPKLIETNPDYLSELQNLPDHERARELYGNWYMRPAGSNYFQREWLIEVDSYPAKAKCCRAWDKSSTEPSELNKNPDYTACSPRMYMHEGLYYIVWDVCPEIYDPKDNENVAEHNRVTGRFRLRAGERDLKMLRQAHWDGHECHIILPKDPGAAGQVEFEHSAKLFTAEGFVVRQDPMPNNKSKLLRFQPFAAACQNGLVRVVRSSFPNDQTYNAFMRELEGFDGERSTRHKKDDFVDACASAFNYISKMKTIRDFTLPDPSSQLNTKTMIHQLKNTLG